MIEMYRPELSDEFMRLAKAMHQESFFSTVSFDEKKTSEIPEKDGVFCALSFRDGVYTGFFVGYIAPYFFSHERDAHDIGVYVLPEHRGSFDGIELIQSFEDWAKSQGVKRVFISQSTGVNVEKTDRLFEILGYKKLGSNTMKEV